MAHLSRGANGQVVIKSLIRYFFIACFISFPPVTFAESVWCEKFDIGCPTKEEKDRHEQTCLRMAQLLYDERIQDFMDGKSEIPLEPDQTPTDVAQRSYNFVLRECRQECCWGGY